ncbi:MAG: agmatine deiminase family protein [Planctomycetes bacterium]|nr:agmatine deiminase family protein [Planctomycetota bacterium]
MTSKAETTAWRMPAEWEPHQATWIAWPQRSSDWPGKFAPIPWVYAEIVRHLQHSEPVHILIDDAAAETKAAKVLAHCDIDPLRIHFFRIPTNRVWTRDHGPIFVHDTEGKLAGSDWNFNAWAKYTDFDRDVHVARRILTKLKLRSLRPHWRDRWVVLEGGSIDVNGQGLLLTSEECLLSDEQARNPGWKREDYERVFADYLGIRKVLWLGRGIAGDDTHGHIDDLARFTGPRTIVTVVEEHSGDANYAPLQENLERLRSMTGLDGKRFEIVTLPMPEALYFRGQRLPASYANFYIANDRVLVPTFNDPHDRVALGIIAELFPGRKVIGIHSVDLVWGFGTLHCLTQQQPATQ